MPIELDVIEHPLELPVEGIEPHLFGPYCIAVENYLSQVRLPEHLRDLKVRISARLHSVNQSIHLRLTLLHDGQLPLPFSADKRRRRPNADLLNELQHVKETVHAALEESNRIWAEAGQIVNQMPNPGDELVSLQSTTGFQAPKRPAAKIVPPELTLYAADRQLTIHSVDTRPEYVETEVQIFQVRISMGMQGMTMKVLQFRNEDDTSDFVTRTAVGQSVRPRWPCVQDLHWHIFSGLGVVLDIPIEISGFAVVSTETLAVKAIQVIKFDLGGVLLQMLTKSIEHVRHFEDSRGDS